MTGTEFVDKILIFAVLKAVDFTTEKLKPVLFI